MNFETPLALTVTLALISIAGCGEKDDDKDWSHTLEPVCGKTLRFDFERSLSQAIATHESRAQSFDKVAQDRAKDPDGFYGGGSFFEGDRTSCFVLGKSLGELRAAFHALMLHEGQIARAAPSGKWDPILREPDELLFDELRSGCEPISKRFNPAGSAQERLRDHLVKSQKQNAKRLAKLLAFKADFETKRKELNAQCEKVGYYPK